MPSIVICEKPSQARNVQKAIGTTYGPVLAAQGHLLRLKLPQEENPAWSKWSTELLRPPSGRYALAPDPTAGKDERLDKIRKAISGADTVFIATDCDREGQAIGENVLRYLGFKGAVKRVIFTAEDEDTLRKSFAGARPNEEFSHLYDAAMARQQADQIFNLSLTRAATVSLVPADLRTVIGIGRVKTPTMGIVCARERELRDFKPKPYFELVADCSIEGKGFTLTHAPAAEKRIENRDLADAIAGVLSQGWQGPISVTRENKSLPPPRPMDLPTLQARAAVWGWTARQTLQTAQALYETHQVITYPRAACRYLPRSLLDAARATYRALSTMRPETGGLPDPVCREGKDGLFFDEGLEGEPHHAIIPNPSVIGDLTRRLSALSSDEKRLFDLIASSFMVALGRDHTYERTEIALVPTIAESAMVFSAVGKTVVDMGWKALNSVADDDGDVENEDAGIQELPHIENGARASIDKVAMVQKTSKAPPRYTEGSLIQAMRNAWQFVRDPAERTLLKKLKGIGTPATRDTVLEGLKAQGYLQVVHGKLHASEMAMQLFDLLGANCPELLDAGSTARMETRLDTVLHGQVTADTVIDEFCQAATRMIAELARGRLSPEVTAKMAQMSHADAASRKTPSGVGHEPSQAQQSFALKIADRFHLAIPEKARHDSIVLSNWIAEHNLATEKQLAWIKRLVEQRRIAPPHGYPDHVSAVEASGILSEAFGKKEQSKPAQ